MNIKILPLLATSTILLLSSCNGLAGGSAGNYAMNPNVDYNLIGRRIWQNECASSVQGLVHWNDGEAFPSLGICHFIWFPRGHRSHFKESFPSFVAFAESQGVNVPSYMKGPAPWPNKRAFLADRSGKADAMRRWLANHVAIQTQYVTIRCRAGLQDIVAASRDKRTMALRITALLATTQGNYCLVDYVNFKGEGLKSSEGYQGQAWGLKQVLEEMRGVPRGRAATAEFSRAAAVVLTRRVRNAPRGRNEQRWLPGWLNRCKTYR
ncbi:MAG: hypothetical protein R3Y56_02450 [Akkermansia sp.]